MTAEKRIQEALARQASESAEKRAADKAALQKAQAKLRVRTKADSTMPTRKARGALKATP